MAKKKKKKKLKFRAKVLLLLFITLIILISYNNTNKKHKVEVEKNESVLKEKYEACLAAPYDESKLSDELKNEMEELTNTIKQKYNVAVKYEDLTSGFSYSYKEYEVFYGASLIKLVDALYLYDNNVDLEKSLVYQGKYQQKYSDGMDNRKIGEKISLKDLMNYAISVSDNTAHMMLIDYIGFNNLKKYGQSLGAKNILNGGDNYGNQSASDTNIYLKRAYEVINSNENGNILKDSMINDYQNYLKLDNDIKVAHKYGSYGEYFHDIGIVFDKYPYTISILTRHGKGNYQDIIKEISKSINVIHEEYRKNIETNCYEQIYN